MKKITICLVLLLVFISLPASALELTLSIPDVNVPRVIAAVLVTHPNIECAKWDLATVTCVDRKYTDEEWVLEVARRILVAGIKSSEQALLDKAMAVKQAEIIKAEEVKIVPPMLDDYELTIKSTTIIK